MRLFATATDLLPFLLFVVAVAVVPRDAAAQSAGLAPTLIPVNGELRTASDEPRTGTVLLAISLYEGEDDPAPRWIEYQPVTLDAQGRYYVQFGATREEGLPPDLFTDANATRWLGPGSRERARAAARDARECPVCGEGRQRGYARRQERN